MLLQLGVYFSGFYMHFLLFTKARCDGNFKVRVFHDFRLRKFMLVPRPVGRCSHFPIVWAIIVRHCGNSLPHFYKKKLLVPLSFNQKWAAGSNCGRKIRAISQYSNREITFQLTKCMCVSRLRFTESTSRDSHKFLSWIRNICYKIQM